MSELSIPISLPLDADGFLRRACPACGRQFKWRPTPPGEEDDKPAAGDSNAHGSIAQQAEAPEAYHCPYCYEPAPPSGWWTTEQAEYARGLAMAEVMGPQLRRFARDAQGLNRPGGSVRIDVTPPQFPRPELPPEPDDMVRVDFPCHPEEPLKVDETWEPEVACLVCGIRYPAELVRTLPEDG